MLSQQRKRLLLQRATHLLKLFRKKQRIEILIDNGLRDALLDKIVECFEKFLRGHPGTLFDHRGIPWISLQEEMMNIVEIAPGDGAVLCKTVDWCHKLVCHHRRNRLAGEKAVDIRKPYHFVLIRLRRRYRDIERNGIAASLL